MTGGGRGRGRPPRSSRSDGPDDRTWLIEVSEPGTDRYREEFRGRAEVGSGVDPETGGLLLVDGRVAARHLVLDAAGDVLWVHDLGSEDGTSIDGVRIGGSAPAPVGCSILLGDSQIRIDGWI